LAEPQFEIFHDESGEFRFRLRAPNGEIVAVSARDLASTQLPYHDILCESISSSYYPYQAAVDKIVQPFNRLYG